VKVGHGAGALEEGAFQVLREEISLLVCCSYSRDSQFSAFDVGK
jgi:hypothetical protein